MKKYSLVIRTVLLAAIMLLISVGFITRLAYLQIIVGPEEVAAASSTVVRTYTELASRGEIYDRTGKPLVTNSLGFAVELDYYEWDRINQNDVILQLCSMLSGADVEYADALPLTYDPPYRFTFIEGEDSNDEIRLRKFLSKQEDWPQNPDANTLFSLLCEKYGVEQDMLLADKRTIVGLRYYLDRYEFSAYNTPVRIASSVDMSIVSDITGQSLKMPGVTIQVDDERNYATIYAAHILGRVAPISAEEYAALKNDPVPYGMNDTLGKDGMEKALESYLRGIDGMRAVEVSRQTGAVVREYAVTPPEPGSHCYLTIDLDLQKVVEDALARGISTVREKGEKAKDKKGADIEGGAALGLDLNTGEVLALASYPTFDLSNYSAGFAENLANPLKPLFDRAVSGAYPPGSTFKMVTAVAGLEEGVITTSTKIRDQGIYTFYDDYQPRCWIYNQTHGTHGSINVSQALKYSCNYFFYDVGRQLTIERLNRYAAELGLGKKTGIELSGENPGNLDGPEARLVRGEEWYDGMTLSAAIGQAGQQLSPLQLAGYVATILNGGTRYRPHLLKSVVDYTGENTLLEQQPEVLSTMNLKDSTIKAVKEGMRGVVTDDGTASSYFKNFPMEVGGKTGSAETRAGRSAHGVFVSFAPYDDPQIVVVVIGEHAGTGGGMAPVCIEIYNHYFGLSVDAGMTAPAQPAAPVTQPATEPATQPVTQPVTEQTTEPAAEPTSAG